MIQYVKLNNVIDSMTKPLLLPSTLIHTISSFQTYRERLKTITALISMSIRVTLGAFSLCIQEISLLSAQLNWDEPPFFPVNFNSMG